MSQENVEAIRAAFDHFNEAGTIPEEFYDPEVTFTTRGDLGHSTYRGIDGMREAVEAFREAWGGSAQAEILGISGSGDVLVAEVRFQLRGVSSGVELAVDEGWAYWMRDGKALRIEQHGSREHALKAAGLRDQ
jgi:SnoaL-like domain